MARRKLTQDKPETAANEPKAAMRLDPELALPELTAKQMKFCERVLAGDNLSDAYRAAYDAENMSSPAIWVAASRLRGSTKLALWLDAARSETLTDHSCTLLAHLKELERLKSIAIRTGNVGAAVQAEQLRGKVAGHYVERHENVTVRDPAAVLRDIAKIDSRLAQAYAKRHNLTYTPNTVEPTPAGTGDSVH